jgi:hypothetical protein
MAPNSGLPASTEETVGDGRIGERLGIAGLAQQRLGALGIVAVHRLEALLELRHVALVARVHAPAHERLGAPLVEDLERLLTVDRAVHRLADADVGPGQIRTVRRIAGALVETVEDRAGLHRRPLGGDDLHALGQRVGLDLARQIGDVGLAGQDQRELGRGLRRPAELHLLEIRDGSLPVVLDALEDHALGRAALDELEGSGAGRLVDVAIEPFGLVLRLAVDQHLDPAGVIEGVVGPRRVEAEHHGMLVERLDLSGADQLDAAIGRLRAGMQLVAVDHVGGGYRPPAEMKLGVLVQMKGPLGEVVVGLPGPREVRVVVDPGMRIVADQALHPGQRLADPGEPQHVGVHHRWVHDDDQPIDCRGWAGDHRKPETYTGAQPRRGAHRS